MYIIAFIEEFFKIKKAAPQPFCESKKSPAARLAPLRRMQSAERCLRTPAHAVINIKNVRFDLVACAVPRELRHLQHLNDGAGIPIAPLHNRGQN
jgi:hypothetical protein